jgi:hypothetical protein
MESANEILGFRVLRLIVVPNEELVGNSYVRVALNPNGWQEINNTKIAQFALAFCQLWSGFATRRWIECSHPRVVRSLEQDRLFLTARAFSPKIEIRPPSIGYLYGGPWRVRPASQDSWL